MKHLILSILFLFSSIFAQPDIAVIGTGYVGLVTGAGLAHFGNTVICVDIDDKKIANLNNGIIPIYEPGLTQLVEQAVTQEKLFFTTNIDAAIETANIIIIAVGTPMAKNGSANLKALKAVAHTIAKHLNSFKIICIKSTVPIGTGLWVRNLLETDGVPSSLFAIVSNPEFLREGSAVQDFLNPDRIVLGTETKNNFDIIKQIYKCKQLANVPVVNVSIATSETIKYASNAFLATKLSFINELANLCDATGANIKHVAHAMGLDNRISGKFLQPGPGYGGSCFPKDSQALLYTAQQHDVNLHVIESSIIANNKQKYKPIEKLLKLLNNNLENKTVAVLGLAFKPNTDDIRYSPAIKTIELLQQHGARITAYDPQATKNMQELFPNIMYCANSYEALQQTDAAIIITDWPEFKELDLNHVKQIMRQPVIVDARNIFEPQQLQKYGFSYATIGVPSGIL